MKKTALIKEYIGKPVDEHGFKYESYANRTWFFTRTVGEFIQVIMVQDNDYSKALDLSFQVKTYNHVSIAFRTEMQILPKQKCRGYHLGTWKYETADDVIQILEHFYHVIETHGIKLLEELSKYSTEARAKEEADRHLFENYEQLKEQYCKIYQIDLQSDLPKIYNQIQEIINKEKGKPFDEVEDLLIGLAAVYGAVLVKHFDGIWRWEEEVKRCIIGGMGKFEPPFDDTEILLAVIIRYWDNDDSEAFIKYTAERTEELKGY